MKKFFVFLLAAVMVSMNVKAQDEPKHEIGVFYGFGSFSNVISEYGTAFTVAVGDQTDYWGPVGVEYYYHISPLVAIGGIAEYAGCKWDSPYYIKGALSSGYFTVMPSLKLNWLRKPNFGMYSSFSAGVLIYNLAADDTLKNNGAKPTEETLANFMFHVTALGVEFGKSLCPFAELGIGEKGILCAGLRLKF